MANKTNHKHMFSIFIIMILLLIIGLLTLFKLSQNYKIKTQISQQPVQQHSQLQFDFYHTLSKNHANNQAKRTPMNTLTTKNTTNNPPKAQIPSQYLQLASFKQKQRAKLLQNKMLRLKIPTTIKSSNKWYQLIAGPLHSKKDVQYVLKISKNHKLKPIVKKIQPESNKT